MSSNSEKFSVSMPATLKQKVVSRITHFLGAEDRSSVLVRDLSRLYDGVLKHGLKTLRKAAFTLEERACLGTLLMSTAFPDPSYIPQLVISLEDACQEMRAFGVDPEVVLTKVRGLDTAALYALVDLIERDPSMSEIA